MVPAGFSPETLGRSNMDVDDVFLRTVSRVASSLVSLILIRGWLTRPRKLFLGCRGLIWSFLVTAYRFYCQPALHMSCSQNRARLSVKNNLWLLTRKLSKVIGNFTGLLYLPITLVSASVLGIPLAPLWDFGKGQFVGVLGPLDFILILRELGTHGSNLTEEELETHTIAAWKEGKAHISRQYDGSGRPYPRPLVQVGPYDNLKDVALKILQNKVAAVPVIYSSLQDGSYPQLLHLASLSGILKCICRYFRHSSSSLPILQQPICSIPLGTWVPRIGESSSKPLATLRPHASLGSALALLVQAEVSSIPVVDDNDSLIDIYSRSDITALAKDKAYAQIHLDDMTVHQALQLGQDASPPYGIFNGQRCHMCLRSDSLVKVMERLANPGTSDEM
ncbi:Contains similarity to Rattus AMP-activated protein kinase (gb/X95577) [Arabidopsis thaliana]|nr:Contains similarity to Rattus AMP-activated protein kinase (gb/X95577) [Arabidopsis thaliana]